jgi:tetratricopeptide (TPR) repeat protein
MTDTMLQETDRHTLTPLTVTEQTHAGLGTSMTREKLLGALADLERFSRVVERYPSYFIVRGELLIALGRTDEARESLKHALKLSPNSARPALLLESLYGPTNAPTAQIKAAGSVTKPLQDAARLSALFGDQDAEPRRPVRIIHAHAEPRSHFDLGQIASLLTRERPLVRLIPNAVRPDKPEAAASAVAPVISETLAGILLGQGKLKEALEAYEHLLANDPEREGYFKERIEIIKKRIRSST